MDKRCRTVFIVLILTFISSLTFGQDAKVNIGKSQIALNELFTISITVENTELRSYSNFPDIKGFAKRGTSSSSSTQIINGRMSSSYSIIQNYQAGKEGKYNVPAFSININDKETKVSGFTIVVGPAINQQAQNQFGYDPFEDFFGGGRNRSPNEFQEVQEDAFFALSSNKKEVYMGEGFSVSMAFYVSEQNRAQLDFFELGKQMQALLRKIKAENCWEENFMIEEITPQNITIGGKRYVQYKLYQAVFYPLNTKTVKFPELELKMVKYKMAKNPTFFGNNRQQAFKSFLSKPFQVKVKDLPPHPLKNSVSVGDYTLDEKINKRKIKTGQSIEYQFEIKGEGNIHGISKPNTETSTAFDFYEPNSYQNITRHRDSVTGNKNFTYFIIPNEPGKYHLKSYINWIYFNYKRKRYDTLSSKYPIEVYGESKKNTLIHSTGFNGFYDRIKSESNKLVNTDECERLKQTANYVVLGFFIVSLILIIRKKKK